MNKQLKQDFVIFEPHAMQKQQKEGSAKFLQRMRIVQCEIQ